MKKLIYMVFASLIIVSCSKENNITPDSDSGDQQKITLHAANENGVTNTTYSFPVDQLMTKSTANSSTNKNNSTIQSAGPIMNGHFSTGTGTTVSFSGSSNNGGVHGNANFNGILDIKFSTACMEIDSNQGVISGAITQITSLPSGLDTLLSLGDYVYFLFVDNGEGSNAPFDQFSSNFYFSPAALGPLCDQITPSSGAWNPAWITDVANQSDQIQIH